MLFYCFNILKDVVFNVACVDHLLRSYWQLMATRRGRVSFHQECCPLEANHAIVDGAIYMHIWVTVTGISTLKKIRTHKIGRGKWQNESIAGVIREGKQVKFEQNTLYIFIKFPTNNQNNRVVRIFFSFKCGSIPLSLSVEIGY